MKILAIETSCDDTGIAILEIKDKRLKPLSNIVSSQKIHEQYGGVFPMMAKREHQKNLVPVMIQVLKESKLLKEKKGVTILDAKKIRDIFKKEQELYTLTKKFLEKYEKPAVDYLAVTYGPGLEPCLWTGVNFARTLSYIWNIPLIPVNHIEAHILVNFLEAKSYKLKAKEIFPAISLVVSGGHTQLILVKKIGDYKIIGETRDDAAGECFDKAAKILGLGYPGGPIISNIASEIKSSSIKLPRPMISSKDYDFSFSGLKTAVLYNVRDHEALLRSGATEGRNIYLKNMCFEVQQAIIDVLLKKTLQAAQDFKVKTIILGGGVSANSELRKQFNYQLSTKNYKLNLLVPPANLSIDNGLMVAVAAALQKDKRVNWKNLKAEANLRIG